MECVDWEEEGKGKEQELTMCHSMLCGVERRKEEGERAQKFLLQEFRAPAMCAWPKLNKVERATF